MMKKYAVAIDGPSGAGKSSLAKRIAKEFGIIYVDTGAIYRTVGLAAFRKNISCKDEAAICRDVLPYIDIKMIYSENGEQRMILNGEDVSETIRLPEISICASDVSALPSVREYLLKMQRKMSEENSVIMDGRDIGTVVLPNADLKIFLTATSQARAQRRLLELQSKGVETSFEDVLKDIEYRDLQDSTRATAPLKEAEDAVRVDTSDIDFNESYDLLCSIIFEHLGVKP